MAELVTVHTDTVVANTAVVDTSVADTVVQTDFIVDYPEVKLIKLLGYGFIGTTYLTEDPKTNQLQVTKLEKFDGDTSLLNTYGRQIAFDNDVAKHHPYVFMTIQSTKIIENSKHVQKVPVKPGFDEKVSAVVNARPHAFVTNYLPVLDGTYMTIGKELTKRQELVLIHQIVTGINAMKLAGYRHRDISARNIMYKINSEKIKSDPNYYQWYIIDYGAVFHKSFPKNSVDYYYEKHRENDIIALVLMLVKSKLYDYALEHDMTVPKFRDLADKIKKHPIYKRLMEYLPADNSSSTKNERNLQNRHISIYKKFVDDKSLVLSLEIFDNYLHASMCLPIKPPMNIVTEQLNKFVLLNLIKHSTDADYNNLLTYLKKLL